MPIIHREDGIPPSKARLVVLGGSFNDTITTMASHIKTFTPPRGKKWQVVAMRLRKGAAAGAGSGVQEFHMSISGADRIMGESVFGSEIDWDINRWKVADSAQAPASGTAAILALNNIIADIDNPLVITYNNMTDVSNATIGVITVHVLEIPII